MRKERKNMHLAAHLHKRLKIYCVQKDIEIYSGIDAAVKAFLDSVNA